MNLTRTSEPLQKTILLNIERRDTPFVATDKEYCTLVLFAKGRCRITSYDTLGGDPQIHDLQAPAALCLYARDRVALEFEDADTYTVVFAPTFLNVNMKADNAEPRWAALAEKHNLFNLSPFLERRMSLKVLPMAADEMDFYLGACASMEAALLMESDVCWSCRARAELMDILLGLEVQYENRALGGCEDANTFGVYRRILACIHGNIHVTCRMAEICRAVGINKNKLQEIFRTYTGRSFYGCVKWVKLEHAKRYLAFTGLDHAEIARRLGFSSAPHFYRFFCDEMGENPRNYRKRVVAERKRDFQNQ